MAYRNRIAARMIALGLAMRAKLGEPDPEALALAVIAVGDSFDQADPLAVEVRHFADLFPLSRRNPELLTKAGESLFRAVERSCWPQPVARVDIEG
ncbi:hypothetical protein KY389_11420 [Paracoccus bogoriensis]|uniref:hypothetical protein n=1 Tax=Paracoccus bogoriensis TaxID=242065 RepID=UPI001CA529DF|nr:hypothetical protein [Paracoccus bogoriensis]MBW7057294.1 hypothetical protein [Paracoccus bogoriensis]